MKANRIGNERKSARKPAQSNGAAPKRRRERPKGELTVAQMNAIAALPPPPTSPRASAKDRARRFELMKVFTPKGKLPRNRPTFSILTFGVGDATYDVDNLAWHICSLLANEGEFFAHRVLRGPSVFGPGDSMAAVKRGEWAEWLAVCGDVNSCNHGEEWIARGNDLPAFGCFVQLDGQSLLYALAEAFGPHAAALGELAGAVLNPGEACALVEALCALEQICSEWCGLATDYDRDGPTRLMQLLGELRVAALSKRIVEHAA